MPAGWVSLGEVAFVGLLLTPLGAALLRGAEAVLGRRFRLPTVERALLAFYAAGALLYVLGSVPLPIFGAPLLWALIALGVAGYSVASVLDHGEGLRAVLRFASTPSAVALLAMTVGLLCFELLPIRSVAFPNVLDGSATSLWITLTLQHHTLPLALGPVSSAGVIYPLGATVWMTVPVLLFGWPIVSAPVLLPSLFLALSVPAAYCWGSRLGAAQGAPDVTVGLLFAGFFAAVASWPRLFVGGSYDFAFALPLFLVAFGWLPGLARHGFARWRDVVAFGAVAGAITSLSLVAGEDLWLVFVALVAVLGRREAGTVRRWALGFLVIIGFEAAFVARSVFGVVRWEGYPYYVLTQTGARPFAPWSPPSGSFLASVQGNLVPFYPWPLKWMVSPFPLLSIELELLLLAGLAALLWVLARGRTGPFSLLPEDFYRATAVATAALLTVTAAEVSAQYAGPAFRFLTVVTNPGESSVLVFLLYSVIALLPLLLAAKWFQARDAGPPGTVVHRSLARSGSGRFGPRRWVRRPGRRSPAVAALALALVVAPLSSGIAASLLDGPGFLHQEVTKTADVTPADVAALVWISAHLPDCSGVFVAPGSAGQFLPEFTELRLVYQTVPSPANLSYYVVLENLTSGTYRPWTRSSLLALSVTEVLVTGQTSVSYAPLSPDPLENSPDFSVVFHESDAWVFAFLPGTVASGCAA